MKIKYTESMAKDCESRGIALITGASYVLGSVDRDLLREVETADCAKLEWNVACSLFTINGPAGKMVTRFGHLDSTGHFIRLRPPLASHYVYASLTLLQANAYDPAAFLSQQLSNPIRRVTKVAKPGRPYFTGILVGDDTKHYSSLLSWDPDNESLVLTDVEPRKAGGGGREESQVDSVAETVASQTVEVLRRVVAKFQLDPAHKPSNTRLRFKAI